MVGRGGFVLRISRVKARVGRVWRALARAGARWTIEARGMSRRIASPPYYWPWGAFGTSFAQRARKRWVFRVESKEIFLFFAVGEVRGGTLCERRQRLKAPSLSLHPHLNSITILPFRCRKGNLPAF